MTARQGRMPPDGETLERRCAALEAENQALRDKLAFYELTVFNGDLLFPPEWRLSPRETRLLGVMLGMRMVHRDAIMTAVYGDDPDDEPDFKIINVMVCKLRRKLKPFGFVIRSVWGAGYTIDEPHRSALRHAGLACCPSPRRPAEHDAAPPASHLSPSRPARTANPGGA